MSLKKILLGILIGFALSMSATAFAEPVKQYILTKVSYPIFVNGQEYKDEKLPALNYEGSTYIPLAKAGDILGVDYRWNAEKNRVEIGEPPKNDTPATTPSSSASTGAGGSSTGLYVTDGTGKWAGYKALHGYPDEDKYQIYFQGDANRYVVEYEDKRGINPNERITWKYNGVTYTHTRAQLYSFFSDTSWFRQNLSGMTNYTLTEQWFLDTFGEVYLDWVEGIGYASDAARWVQKYFEQTAPKDPNMPFVTLTPDAKFVPVEQPQPEKPSVDEVIQGVEGFMYNLLSEEEKIFAATWIGELELKNKYGITVTSFFDIKFRKNSETIFVIENVPTVMKSGEVLTGNGVRYMYYKDDPYRWSGLYFNREDLRNLGIIP